MSGHPRLNAGMRLRRVMIVASVLIVTGILCWVGLTIHWNMQQPQPRDFGRLVKAMQEYSRNSAAAGKPGSNSMSVADLVNSGYLSSTDARIFAGMDVFLTLNGDVNRPENILIQVRLQDGTIIAQTADGAVQESKK